MTARLMTVKEVSELLSISERKLWQLTHDGEIPHVRIGSRTIRFDEADLAAWLAQQKQGRAGDE